MKLYKFYKLLFINLLVVVSLSTSCSLDEYNPSGYTLETVSENSVEGYKTILNNCYLGWQQRMYGCMYWTLMCEAGTDLWTHQRNSDSWIQYFKYELGLATRDNAFKDQWFAFYDGIGSCNKAIQLSELAPFKTTEEKNALVAEAYFLRAVYYYHLVEQYGGVTLILKPADNVDLQPQKTDPLTIYKQAILPDLEFAAKWLPITNEISRPSKKSAMGFLAMAYLQTVGYDETKEFASKALTVAKQLIDDCENGGTLYNTFLYPSFSEVFREDNNFNNKEALWAHRFVQGGNPRAAQELNENNTLFYCPITSFGAMQVNYTAWGGLSGGRFMPSHYLLKTFVQDDGTLDPRYHQSFQTLWYCNRAYSWTTANLLTYDRTAAVSANTPLALGDTAVLLVHPNEIGYNNLTASKLDKKYLVVDLSDVYINDTVRMRYTRQNDGTVQVNPFNAFYPSLSKHNSSNVFLVTGTRYGNLNATFIMRMAEVYLIAAEADLYVNGGANTLGYLNKIRSRAGAIDLVGTPTIQTILDERARELCGEYARYYDLKRTGNLSYNYLMAKNPDVGKYFNDNKNKVRQIPISFLQTLKDGGTYYQNPGY